MISLDFRGQHFDFADEDHTSSTLSQTPLANEVIAKDNYRIFSSGMEFHPGDIVLDIGANEGYFSIMLAKCFPDIKVCAYEPTRTAFRFLLKNLSLNNINNVEPHFEGISNLTGRCDLKVHPFYSTCSSAYIDSIHSPIVENCAMVPLDTAIERCGGRVKLLKIDIEGGEYDALYPCTMLDRVDTIVGEFHTNGILKGLGYDMDKLVEWLGERVKLGYIERKEIW